MSKIPVETERHGLKEVEDLARLRERIVSGLAEARRNGV